VGVADGGARVGTWVSVGVGVIVRVGVLKGVNVREGVQVCVMVGVIVTVLVVNTNGVLLGCTVDVAAAGVRVTDAVSVGVAVGTRRVASVKDSTTNPRQ